MTNDLITCPESIVNYTISKSKRDSGKWATSNRSEDRLAIVRECLFIESHERD